VPLGGGAGKIVRFGRLPVNFQLQAYYNAVTPDNGADWQLRFQVQFLWVGRYYVQESTLLGMSLLPSAAYRVTDKFSLGGSLNIMYGILKDQVAVNNTAPSLADGRLKPDDNTWGVGVNLGLLYELSSETRFSLTYNSQVDLDFKAPAEFSNLGPGLETLLRSRGLLNANVDLGITVPQQMMVSVFHQF
jgi:long-chain fatty acid transport protein